MQPLKIKFVDFWFGFEPGNNYFFRLLSLTYSIELCNDPQILIYSCYGSEHLKYDCIKVFYTAENLRPDFSGCDFAVSFDQNSDRRHYRLPLYAIYLDYPGRVEKLETGRSAEEAFKIWTSKKKFCCMVVSNGQSAKRLRFFEKLSKYKIVDSGGSIMNNVGGPVKDKMDFISDYRFVFAFENASHPGYTTEKIVEPFLADCIPIYWGDPLIGKEFNTNSFLNLDNSKSEAILIDEIIAIDTNEEKALKMLMEPKFANAQIPGDLDKEKIKRFFDEIIHISAHKIPVAKTWRKYIHLYKTKRIYYNARVKIIVNALAYKIGQRKI